MAQNRSSFTTSTPALALNCLSVSGNQRRWVFSMTVMLLMALLLSGCGGDSTSPLPEPFPPSSAPKYTVGGTVSGLGGSSLSIALNSEEPLAINSNGSFAFPQTLADNSAYSVAITSHPSDPAQVCDISNGSGSISSGDVADIAINCIQHNVNLSWSANSESDLQGYNIYYGEYSDALNSKIFVSSSESGLTFTPSRFGNHYFSISALDNSGNESPLSTAIFIEVN